MPLRRSAQLYPLSWQHHNALMVVLLVKKGIRKAADPGIIGLFLVEFWHETMHAHVEAEESVLAIYINANDLLSKFYAQMLEDHQQMREIIDVMERAHPDFVLINQFQQLLEQHIRFEERVFFPALEQKLSSAHMEALGHQLRHLPANTCISDRYTFWK